MEQEGRSESALFEVDRLRKWYVNQDRTLRSLVFGGDEYLRAVDDISFTIKENEILGVAGQSGCGKSTLGELLLRLQEPTGGEIFYEGEPLSSLTKTELKKFRQKAQIIFQDPYEALNPRFTVTRLVEEPLLVHGLGGPEERDARIMAALEDSGLTPPEKYLDKLPYELSGGERQRVSIARAIATDPKFIVADEPVSMLDVSISTGILKLFKRLQREREISMLYISHDLSTIAYLADRTMIMYLGNIVEVAETSRIINTPAHPYTEALLDAVPQSDPDYIKSGSGLKGEVPDPINLPTGCRFRPWCEYSTEICADSEPDLESVGDSQEAACFHPVHGHYERASVENSQGE